MKNKLIYPLMVVALVACGGDEKPAGQAAANYETVQEGSAAGVTSTIAGPGETVPPLTGTNADTTTAFTLNPNAAAPASQPAGGTIAGTLPASSYPVAAAAAGGGSTTYRQPATATRTAPAPRPAASRPATQPMYSSSSSDWGRSEPQQQPVRTEPVQPTQPAPSGPAPAPTDTTTAEQPAPAADTAPPPAQPQQQPKKEKKENEQKPPAEAQPEGEGEGTDTAEPPPPPPGR